VVVRVYLGRRIGPAELFFLTRLLQRSREEIVEQRGIVQRKIRSMDGLVQYRLLSNCNPYEVPAYLLIVSGFPCPLDDSK